MPGPGRRRPRSHRSLLPVRGRRPRAGRPTPLVVCRLLFRKGWMFISSRLPLRSKVQERGEYRGIAVRHVLGGGHQSDRTIGRQFPQTPQRVRGDGFGQLGLVAAPELLEPRRGAAVPAPQVRRRGDVLQPQVQARGLLRDPPGPDPVDQHAVLPRLGLVIDPYDAHVPPPGRGDRLSPRRAPRHRAGTHGDNGSIRRQTEEPMARLAQTSGLTDVQQDILSTVRRFVDREIIPTAQVLEHADAYPEEIVRGMAEMGLFGLTIPEEYGGLGESLLTYALVVEEIARGWMSDTNKNNTHFIVAYLLVR